MQTATFRRLIMDLLKSLKSRSTSSNHSKSSHKSKGSNSGNLVYYTSTSSISPYAKQFPSSSKFSNVVIKNAIISSSDSSIASPSYPQPSTIQNALKRKRKSLSLDQDPDLEFDLPLAKRQQQHASYFHSAPNSVSSSVYPSPFGAGGELLNDIDTRSSSSDCLSLADIEDVVAIGDMPDSPRSLHHEETLQGPDCGRSSDDEVVSSTVSPSSVCSTVSSKSSSAYVVKNTTRPPYTTARAAVTHHGERTPSHRQSTAAVSCSFASGDKTQANSLNDYAHAHYDCLTPAAEPTEQLRQCPLPALTWANASDVWQRMCKKDELAALLRDPDMFEQQAGLQPRMRAILLDWLIEVCEVYKLHRETYYLAVDYLDRYLSAQKNVQKTHLQLIGITCLFVASKVEEIYPPKIGEFAYVTDGACQENDILRYEVLLLQTLEWSISPVTPMGWLGVYMQLNVSNLTPASFGNKSLDLKQPNPSWLTTTTAAPVITATETEQKSNAFIYPQFSGMEFVQTAQLLDLCSLDLGISNFPYSVIAAAAMSHTFNRETALRCSGFDWQTIENCARWMEPFFNVISAESKNLCLLEQNEQVASKFGLGHICPNIVLDDSHIIQTHTITMAMFDRVCLLQEQQQQLSLAAKIKQEASPATGLICPAGLLTPPASSRKPLDVVVDDEDDDEEAEEEVQSESEAEVVDSDAENRENITIVSSSSDAGQ